MLKPLWIKKSANWNFTICEGNSDHGLPTILVTSRNPFPGIQISNIYPYLCPMGSIRQNKIEGVIQEELSTFFQRNAREICLGAMVSVTQVRITSDLSLARCYLSIFAGPDKKEVLESIQTNSGRIRGEVGKRLKNMKKMPDLAYFIDDSLDYAMEIDQLLKK